MLPMIPLGLLTLVVASSSCVEATKSSDKGVLAVSNHEDGSTVRYSVILLRGTVDPGTSKLEIRNARATKGSKPVSALVHGERFKALVELAEGRNKIELRTDRTKEPVEFEINFKPQTNPYYVRLIWMTDNTGNTKFATPDDGVPQDYEARLRTAGLLMQTFTAEKMHDVGFGRRTFRLERDNEGKVVVHTLEAPESAEYYYAIGDNSRYWAAVGRWLNREHPDRFAKNVVLAAFTRKDPKTGKMKGHTALGGGNLGLFGSASVFSWPRSIADAAEVFMNSERVDPAKVHDDSAGRGVIWGLASTTIGATLHEMGHTFGLPHCKDPLGIMTRGFDRFNRAFTFKDPPSRIGLRGKEFTSKEEAYFAPISASYLRWSRWFALDEQRYHDDAVPSILIDKAQGVVKFHSSSGVPWVGFWVGSDIVAYREFKIDEPWERKTIRLEEIETLIGGKPLSKVSAMGSNGKSSSVKVYSTP